MKFHQQQAKDYKQYKNAASPIILTNERLHLMQKDIQ